jgi:hypothetical protein
VVNVLNEFLCTKFPESSLLGPSTFNIGKIEGGVSYNIVPASSTALCAVRVATDMAECKRIVSEVVAKHQHVRLEFKFEYPETLLDHDVEGCQPCLSVDPADGLQGSKQHLYHMERMSLDSREVIKSTYTGLVQSSWPMERTSRLKLTNCWRVSGRIKS